MTGENSIPLETHRKPGIFYGYIIVTSGFLIMMIIHGTVNTFGVFFNPLQDYFNTSRASLSAAFSLSFFTMGLGAIVMGILSDRFGPRKVMTIFALFFGVGYILLSQVTALWQLYLVFIIIGIGFSPSDVVPLSTVVRWFVKKRGMMSGIMKVGTGLGMTVVPLAASVLITRFDWRISYLILGILVLVTAIPLAQLLKRDPSEIGQLPDGEKLQVSKNSILPETGLTFHEAIRTRQLWLVCGFYAVIFYIAQSVLVHIIPYAVDLGISQTTAASLISVIGGSSIFGRLVMGFTGDKIGHKRAVSFLFLIMIAALAWLQVATELWMLYLFATIYGFNHGGFFALISPLIAGLFGTRSQGTLLGTTIFSGTLFGSISPVITGRIFDVTHSYQGGFIILLFVAITGLIFTTLLKPINKEGKR
ncbi:MAG: MFS transporter [Dehalococcoidales bacterium]